MLSTSTPGTANPPSVLGGQRLYAPAEIQEGPWWVWGTNMITSTKNGLARREIAPTPVKEAITLPLRPPEDVGDPPESDDGQSLLIWDEDDQAADNYRML